MSAVQTEHNQRVTLAVLAVKLDNNATVLDELRGEVREFVREQRACNQRVDTELTRLKERQNIMAGLQLTVSTALATFAAWFGAQR